MQLTQSMFELDQLWISQIVEFMQHQAQMFEDFESDTMEMDLSKWEKNLILKILAE